MKLRLSLKVCLGAVQRNPLRDRSAPTEHRPDTECFSNAHLLWKPIFPLEWLVLKYKNCDDMEQQITHKITNSFRMRTCPAPLSQRQTSNGMTKPMLYRKTHTAWQKTYCMSFAMPSYFQWIHGKTHVISAPPYPWLFPCSNLSLVSQLFAFDSTF